MFTRAHMLTIDLRHGVMQLYVARANDALLFRVTLHAREAMVCCQLPRLGDFHQAL